ncbi:MAG: type II secretion system protein N [Xylophilus ampelinus]
MARRPTSEPSPRLSGTRTAARGRARPPVGLQPTARRWAAIGAAAGAAAALVACAPARWLAAALEDASAGHLRLAAPRGTVWEGSAQLQLTGGAGSTDRAGLPGRVSWTLRPTWRGGLAATVAADCCTAAPLRLALQPRWRGMKLDVADGRSRWPAALLAGLGTPWNTLQPQGELALSTRGLAAEWAAGRLVLSGGAQLEALGMSSRLSTLQPMGSYRLQFDGGAAPTLTLSSLPGSALQLAGTGRWIGGRLRFEGEASAAPEREAALANLLNIIGRRNGARSLITLG